MIAFRFCLAFQSRAESCIHSFSSAFSSLHFSHPLTSLNSPDPIILCHYKLFGILLLLFEEIIFKVILKNRLHAEVLRHISGGTLLRRRSIVWDSLVSSGVISHLKKMLDGYLNNDQLQSAPAAERNKTPILEVLQKVLPANFEGEALEVSSGTGQHVTFFAKHFPYSRWQPTEFEPSLLSSISAYISAFKSPNVSPPFTLDASRPFRDQNEILEAESFHFIICTNLIHIAPWNVAEGLFAGAGHLLKPDGVMITYGPYAVDGVLSPESNVRFDKALRSRDSSWGIRDVEDVKKLAERNRLTLEQIIEMPANNKCLLFRKVAKDTP